MTAANSNRLLQALPRSTDSSEEFDLLNYGNGNYSNIDHGVDCLVSGVILQLTNIQDTI